MTKHEKIKEAYGYYFNAVKIHIDENGWFENGHNEPRFYFTMGNKIDMEYHPTSDTLLRPKSLQGIEDNRGWIKIEDDVDEDVDCWVFTHDLEVLFLGKEEYLPLGIASHYQPIQIPKPPIY